MKFSRLAILAALPLLFACEPVNKRLNLPDDNLIEETTEAVIHMKTGINVDLTPSNVE